MLDLGRKVAVPAHSMNLPMLGSKVPSLTNVVEVKELDLCQWPGLKDEALRLREQIQKARSQ